MEYKKTEPLTFSQIVLKQLVAISEISIHELRDDTRTIYTQNQSQIEVRENTTIGYIQAVENLGYLLQPHFDEKIKKVFDKNIKKINSNNFEIEEVFKEDLEKIKKYKSININSDNFKERFAIEMKLKLSKEIYSELNMLLKRQNYLSKVVYGETSEEIEIPEGETD